MDFRLSQLRLGAPSRPRILVRPEEGFRAVMEQAPRAEAVAVEWIERTRPGWTWLVREWRLLGTIASVLLIIGLMLHAIFGANGMVVYRQKKAEMQTLQADVDRLQKENALHGDRIKELKSNPAAIEKEAREQLHYTRKGEIIFVSPESQKPVLGPTSRASSGK